MAATPVRVGPRRTGIPERPPGLEGQPVVQLRRSDQLGLEASLAEKSGYWRRRNRLGAFSTEQAVLPGRGGRVGFGARWVIRRKGTSGEPVCLSGRDTLRGFGTVWLDQRRGRITSSTMGLYLRCLEGYVYPQLGDRQLRSLRYRDFDDLVRDLVQAGLAPSTVRGAITPVRSMLSDAVRQDLIRTNPAKGLGLPRVAPSVGVDIPDDHLRWIRQALADQASLDPHRTGERDFLGLLAFDVALGTGLRWSELSGLKWGRCDFRSRLVHVEEALVAGELRKPKYGGSRVVPMFPTVERALRELAARAIYHGQRAPHAYVFTTTAYSKPLALSHWGRNIWRPAVAAAQLLDYGYRWYDLRHTCLSRLVAQGADIGFVRAIAGHTDPVSTLKLYTHLRLERAQQGAHIYDPGNLDNNHAP